MFDSQSENFSLPELEERVLRFWKEHGIFAKSLEKNKGKKKYVFFEGPPTANGRPGIHHVLARSFKDLIPRYKTMRGFEVPRMAGWDTHGLPVEIQAEKELGLTNKKEIETYGIDRFNAYCRELVWRYRGEFETVTDRMGYWIDMDNAYVTYKNNYIESLWWVIAQVEKRKLLYKGHRVAPWCVRCGTALSSHELAQGYKEKKSTSVYVKFAVKKGQKIGKNFVANDKTYFVSWTTTPWTLPGNVALAVGKNISYVLTQKDGAVFVVAESLVSGVLGEVDETIATVTGKELAGLTYAPLFENKALVNKKSHRVYCADFVTDTDGTGIVHTAVMYGEDDYALGVAEGLPQHHTVTEQGVFTKEVPGLRGKSVLEKKTEDSIFAFLKKSGAFLKTLEYTHDYPHCWRCSTPLLYYARTSWFIEMSKLKKELLAANKEVNWTPAHIKEGRFGEWLKDVKDWNFSRARYWGTPLPVWECTSAKCSHREVVSGKADLYELRKSSNTYFGLRHGQSDHNVGVQMVASGPEVSGKTSQLTKVGIAQVEAVAQKLKKEKIQIIYTSPYVRCKKTAQIIAKATKAKVIVDKRLGEWNTGVFNWKTHKEFVSIFKDNLERFTKRPEKGENLNDIQARSMDFVTDIDTKYKNKRILIISHADPLWILEGALAGASEPEELLASTYYPGHEPYSYQKFLPPHLPYNTEGRVDLHRPYIDSIKLSCPKCKSDMKRVLEVCDVWFDSGAMPFAAHHFPFSEEDVPLRGKALASAYEALDFPADYICEAIDQTRGWFYTLLATATLLGRGVPYKNVISLGLVHDKNGIKMSKSKGNIVLPMDMMQKYSADAVRWYFYTINHPGDPKNFNEDDLAKVVRRFLMIVYNTHVFLKTYGSSDVAPDGFTPKHILDQWILSSLGDVTNKVTKHLESYQIGEAARLIEDFVADLSRWYVRRSRPRFQDAARGIVTLETDWREASMTLRFVLSTLSKLMAPFTPFFAEALYTSVDTTTESVHLAAWPKFSKEMINKDLLASMATVRSVAATALALRAEHGLKVRQPLTSLSLKDSSLRGKKELLEVLMDEVNVREIKFSSALKAEGGVVLDTELTPELVEEGIIRELARMIQSLRAEAKYAMSDEIVLMISAPEDLMSLIQRRNVVLKKMVNAKTIELHVSKKHDAYIETKLKDWKIAIGVRVL